MSWSSLPNDMVELILAKLSIVELARIYPMSSSFQAFYRERMAVQQQSRLDLAFNLCGRERIEGIVALVAHCLLGRPLRRDFRRHIDGHLCNVSADGVLHDDGPHDDRGISTIEWGYFWLWDYGDVDMKFWFPPREDEASEPPDRGLVVRIRRSGIVFIVKPSDDEDLQPVAVVQAMLNGGLAQFLHQTGKWAEINVRPSSANVTHAGLKAQILPLLPFASRYIPGEGEWVDYWNISGERVRVGVVGSTRCKRMASRVRGWVERVVRPVPHYPLLREVVREGCVKWVLRGWTSLFAQLRDGQPNP